jgi:hypothetical protein
VLIMQMEFSFEFAAALEKMAAADEAFDATTDTLGEAELELHDLRFEEMNAALDALVLTPAETAAGVREKLSAISKHWDGKWCVWPQYEAAIDRDLLELRRPNSTLHAPFEAWRAAYEAHAIASDLDEDDEDLDGEELRNEEIAFRALMAAPCASPGDFMVKAYANLLDQLGSAEHGEAKLDGTGHLWDIDVPHANSSDDLDTAWECSAYHDLDMSDLGACLLAFGRLDFSAEDWLRRARALKVSIGLTVTGPNEWSLHVGPYAGDDDCERRRRERVRLDRLLEFDPARRQAVVEVILRAWPLPDAPLAKAA